MNVLFLDVDGVLNNEAAFIRHSKEDKGELSMWVLDDECVQLLKEVVQETGCKLVLSSTWRKHEDAIKVLESKGLKFIGKTKSLPGIRGLEIERWLKDNEHLRIEKFAILDDDSDMLKSQKPKFVQTSFKTGLQREHVKKLKVLLI